MELEKLPDQIDTLEKEQTAINNELANPDTYKDAEKVKSLQTKLNEIEVLLLDAISRWEELESKKSAS
jgi:ATP-binding cassette subfamily F protein uup